MTARIGGEPFPTEVTSVFRQLYSKFLRGRSLRGWLHRNSIDEEIMSPQLSETGEFAKMVEPASRNRLDLRALARALEQLPQDYRVVFGLHDICGCEHEEIANRLGISINASKSQLHGARLKLRALLFVR